MEKKKKRQLGSGGWPGLRTGPPPPPPSQRGPVGCAPAARDGATACSCLSADALGRIAAHINRADPGAVPAPHLRTPCELIRLIRAYYGCGERDWPGLAGREARKALRPPKDPVHPLLLSTQDHTRLLKQYMALHPDFQAFDALPNDFCRVSYGQKVCHLDLRALLQKGKRRCAVVFNTDPSTAPGKHWVLLWIDMGGPGPTRIAYLDSEGNAPSREVRGLMDRLRVDAARLHAEDPGLLPPPAPSDPAVVIKKRNRHQVGGIECGIYAIYFTERLLSGTPVAALSGETVRITNEDMQEWCARELFPDATR